MQVGFGCFDYVFNFPKYTDSALICPLSLTLKPPEIHPKNRGAVRVGFIYIRSMGNFSATQAKTGF